jgi:hypothetical protein
VPIDHEPTHGFEHAGEADQRSMRRGVHEGLVQSVGGAPTLVAIGKDPSARGEHFDQPRQ